MKEKFIALADRNSGYVSNVKNWAEFLQCWNRYIEKNQNDSPSAVLWRYGADATNLPSIDEVRSAISKLETTLGFKLPKSYKDFVETYRPSVLLPRKGPWGTAIIGFYAPSQVGKISELDRESVDLARKYPIDSGDEEYFVYGAKQSNISGRTNQIEGAILVGKYGPSSFEKIILYPQVKTKDGEMEAALSYQAGEFRAPSFAELMRQLSVLETQGAKHVPPYSQDFLKGTCADMLPLRNVWWD